MSKKIKHTVTVSFNRMMRSVNLICRLCAIALLNYPLYFILPTFQSEILSWH